MIEFKLYGRNKNINTVNILKNKKHMTE